MNLCKQAEAAFSLHTRCEARSVPAAFFMINENRQRVCVGSIFPFTCQILVPVGKAAFICVRKDDNSTIKFTLNADVV